MSSNPIIFDRQLLRARRRRAQRLGASDFLIERVAEDVAERLAVVLRRFEVAVDLGTPGDATKPCRPRVCGGEPRLHRRMLMRLRRALNA